MAKCKGCGAEIVWGVTSVNGKAIPLDAKDEVRPTKVGVSNDGAPIVELRTTFMPHHATCPNVADFRKPK